MAMPLPMATSRMVSARSRACQSVQRAKRAHHECDALHDAERAWRLAGDQLDAEGSSENENYDPCIEGGRKQIERGHAVFLKSSD
jgi:hypothetical protein